MKGLRWKSEKCTIAFENLLFCLSFFLSFFFYGRSLVGNFYFYIKNRIFISLIELLTSLRTDLLRIFCSNSRGKSLKEDVSILHVSPFICIFFSARDLRHRDSRRNFLINPANVKPPFRESLLETHLQRASHVAMAVFRRFRSSYYLRARFEQTGSSFTLLFVFVGVRSTLRESRHWPLSRSSRELAFTRHRRWGDSPWRNRDCRDAVHIREPFVLGLYFRSIFFFLLTVTEGDIS